MNGRWRSRTVSLKALARERREEQRVGVVDPELEQIKRELDASRPRTRADCERVPRPCPFLACVHHLYLDVNPETGSIKFNFPDREAWELEETCALDVADRGGVTLETVGALLHITREGVRQMETRALFALKRAFERAEVPRMSLAEEPQVAGMQARVAARFAAADRARDEELSRLIRAGKGSVAPRLCGCGSLEPLGRCSRHPQVAVQEKETRHAPGPGKPGHSPASVEAPVKPEKPAPPAKESPMAEKCEQCGGEVRVWKGKVTQPCRKCRAGKGKAEGRPKKAGRRPKPPVRDKTIAGLEVEELLELRAGIDQELEDRRERAKEQLDALNEALGRDRAGSREAA